MSGEISAVRKTYDLALWLLPHVAGFSRRRRFTLGDRMEEGVLEILELLVEASYVRESRSWRRRRTSRGRTGPSV